jgi:hypothetical protein
MQYLLSRLTMRSVGDIVAGVWTIVFMMQVGLFDFLVGFIEPSTEDVFYSCVRWQRIISVRHRASTRVKRMTMVK